MEQYEKLRREYPRFYYHGYEAEWGEEALNITYTFEIEGLSVFTPRWTFPSAPWPAGRDKKPGDGGDALFPGDGGANQLLEGCLSAPGLY